MTRDEVMADTRRFLAGEFPARAEEVAQVPPAAPLFELGLLDSLSFLGLVSGLEQRYGISVPPADFTPERFRSLEAVAAYVLAAPRPG